MIFSRPNDLAHVDAKYGKLVIDFTDPRMQPHLQAMFASMEESPERFIRLMGGLFSNWHDKWDLHRYLLLSSAYTEEYIKEHHPDALEHPEVKEYLDRLPLMVEQLRSTIFGEGSCDDIN